ncbi:MAG TPA: FkbM family methyltransferase [Cyclobacteriaceae bacterium]|nr:FkbM family methyltransferase [Cyclobacteriaceae bacterium]
MNISGSILKLKRKVKNVLVCKKLNLYREIDIQVEKLGTEYGGWYIPINFLNDRSICYLAGAGTDISFDVAIIEKYGSNVYIFDPTPKAKKHVENLKYNTRLNIPTQIGSVENSFYHLKSADIDKIKFFDLGLWVEKGMIKFYKPRNPDHVSHSILNIQKTADFIELPVERLRNVMNDLKHDTIDLLKMDIEGAEYKVIQSILEDQIAVKVICIEFDEITNPIDDHSTLRIRKAIIDLKNAGFKIGHIDDNLNIMLAHKDYF